MPFFLYNRLDQIKTFLTSLLAMEGFNSPVIRKRILYCAMALFGVGIILSLNAQPDILQSVSIGPTILVLLAVIVTLAISSFEFQLTARLCGNQLSFIHALETVIIGNAANMLPLPGNVMVKVSRLKSIGIQYKKGVVVTVLMAIAGVGLVFIYAGLCLLYLSSVVMGGLLLCTGFVGLVLVSLYIIRLYQQKMLLFKLILTRVCLIMMQALRLYLCMIVLGVSGGFAQASILTVSIALSSAVTIVPAGLGLQEFLSACIAPFIGITAASAYLMSSLNRIIAVTIVFVLSSILTNRIKEKA